MNEILQGSVFDRINDVPDGWADVILTDPPYNSGGTARDKKAATGRKYCDDDYNGAHRFPDFGERRHGPAERNGVLEIRLRESKEENEEGGAVAYVH